MTLPGIAGMILTIGVAADANVVIFERIKEEVRLGKTVRAAISSGYTKGFHTIVDANVVTLITAGVLFMAGTGSVKGFAFTLAVGVLVSMFTAVLATRAMLALLARLPLVQQRRAHGRVRGRRCAGASTSPGRKYLWFAISGVVVLIAAGSLATRGPQPRHRLQGRHARSTTTFVKPATQRAGHRRAREGQRRTCARTRSSRAAAIRRARAGRQVPALRDQGTREGALADGDHEGRDAARPQFGIADDKNDNDAALRLEVVSASFGSHDPDRRDLRDHLLDVPDRRVPLGPLRVQVRAADDRRAVPRRGHHDRRLLADGAGGDGCHRRRGADGARLLALRHDHRVRPRAREHAAAAQELVRADRQRLDLGDADALAQHVADHARSRSRRCSCSAARR